MDNLPAHKWAVIEPSIQAVGGQYPEFITLFS
jgi:hypothetical protein